MLERRLQILIDDERYRRIAERASARGVSIARVVREAIDAAFPGRSDRRRSAARAITSAEPMPVPSLRELREELDALRARRG